MVDAVLSSASDRDSCAPRLRATTTAFLVSNKSATIMCNRLLIAILAALGAAWSQGAAGQGTSYPTRPINVIVPFAAGGPTDVVARIVGEHMSRTLGQQLVVENVGGAGGTTGMTRVAQAPAMATPSASAIWARSRPPPRSIPTSSTIRPPASQQIGIANYTPQAIVAKKDTAAKDLKEFIAYLKANSSEAELRPCRGRLDLARVGHRVQRAVRPEARRSWPIAAPRPPLNDLVGGQIDYMVDQSLNVIPQIKGGTIKAYAVAAPERLESLPDVPTTKEQGVDFIFSAWNAMVAPKGTPKEIVDKLVDALNKALDDPATIKALRRTRQHRSARRRSRPGRPAEAGRERDGAHHAGAEGGRQGARPSRPASKK